MIDTNTHHRHGLSRAMSARATPALRREAPCSILAAYARAPMAALLLLYLCFMGDDFGCRGELSLPAARRQQPMMGW